MRQKMNLRLVIVETGMSKCSNATISSADTMLPLMFRHSIWLSLNALASSSISSIMIKLLLMSRSLRVADYLMTSASISADLPDIFVSEMWHTLIVGDFKRAFAISNPQLSPIWLLLLILISFKVLLVDISLLVASAMSESSKLWLMKNRANLGSV